MERINVLIIALTAYTAIATSPAVRLATYNIRREGPEISHSQLWDNRKEELVEHIQDIAPDVLCLQEVTTTQQQHLEAQMNRHYTVLCRQGRGKSWAGMGTDEALPILFRSSRFVAIASGRFRLNDLHTFAGHIKALFNPKKRGFLPRICTWAVLKDTTTKQRLLILNTHLDNKFEQARVRMLRKINKQIKKLKKQYTPDHVCIMGDFNADIPGALQACIPQFTDTKSLCQNPTGPTYTHPGWDQNVNTNIDHIMLEGDPHAIVSHEVMEYSSSGLLISDHWPVTATLQL